MNEPLMEYRPRRWVDGQGRPEPLVWHEAAHALVGYRLGMRVQHLDMTGAHAPCPSCGLDETTVPETERARATGLAALAGPVAESMADGEPPRWREDGQVAKEAARALASDVAEQMELVLEWRREARRMLEGDPAYVPLVRVLAERERLTGEELETFLREIQGVKYPLSQHDGHLLIEVDGRRYLVDTGSPWSLGSQPVQLGGREFPVQPSDLMGNTCESIAGMVGIPFDGLLGTDILGEFDLEFSVRDGVLRLSATLLDIEDGPVVESVHGVPLVGVEIGGEVVPMFFDTGAPLSYLSEEWVQGRTALGEVEDFHPLLGRFQVSTHAVELSAWGLPMRIRAGRAPVLIAAALGVAGAQGILGTEILQHGVVRWSSRQQRMALVVH